MRSIPVLLGLVALVLGGLSPSTHAEEEKEEKKQKLFFSGDLRGRYEAFRFSEDETGSKKDPRRRVRYRLRLNATALLNRHSAVKMQVGTGDLDHRSGNQTIGSPIDFGPNEFDIRQAYLIFYPYSDGELPGDKGKWAFQFGRVANPFLWKNGKDIMLWDNDINPGGASTTFDVKAGGAATLFANAGYFVIQEKSSDPDIYLAAIQAGIHAGKKDSGVSGGIRGTFYGYNHLDSLFIVRGVDGTGGLSSSGGNIPDGLTGSVQGGSLNVIETQVYVKTNKWRMLAFGGYSNNLSAEPSELLMGVGKNSIAWNLGLEGGDKKKVIRLGGAYFHLEANAFPSQFVDSDALDGFTNRQGFMLYLARYLFKGVDFKFTGLASDAIETAPEFAESVKNSERVRLIADLVYKF